MLTGLIFLGVLLGLAVVFFLTASESEGKRQRALQALAKILGSEVVPIAGEKNSFRMAFQYKGKSFIYEDIEDIGFQGRVAHWGMLRLPMDINFTLTFTEREMGTVKENVSSFSDIRNPWVQNIGKLISPPSLQSFILSSNNNSMATILLSDVEALKAFENFKAMDSRGHPVMSLEFLEGTLSLKFHAADGLKPALVLVYNNPSSIQEYLDCMIPVVDKVEKIHQEMKARNLS